MGKRSDKKKIDKDKYRTPPECVDILRPHLHGIKTFTEPCAGDARLARNLERRAGLRCVGLIDISPDDPRVEEDNALTRDLRLWGREVCGRLIIDVPDAIITNSPWTRAILHEMITRFSDQLPTWLLIDADWAHTKQAARFMDRCSHIVSIGRVKWIQNTKMTGKDNAAWYRFHAQHTGGPKFFGRTMNVTE